MLEINTHTSAYGTHKHKCVSASAHVHTDTLIRDTEKGCDGGYSEREQGDVQGCSLCQEQGFGYSYGQEGNDG